ncbi:MAG: phosphotransferase [Acidobacteriota bacterium]
MGESPIAHGLDGTLVEPDWPPLTLPELRPVLSCFEGMDERAEILSVSPRPFSAASVIATGKGRVFVKRHSRLIRTAEALREEHRFMAHLLDHGVGVPLVLPTEAGDTVVEDESSIYELHSVPEGVDLYQDAISWTPFLSPEHARSAGEMLASLHVAAESYEAPARSDRPLVASFTIFASSHAGGAWNRYTQARPALRAYLSESTIRETALEVLAPFHEELLVFIPYLKPLWTHNDLHASNLFWSDGTDKARATAVIDFGLCDRTNAVHDLAQAIERNCVEWLALMQNPQYPEGVRIHRDHLWALLDGYEAARPLPTDERAAIAPMLALCHAEFALSEADYFLTALHSEEKARVACEDYLVGHAKWWRGAGAAMLDEVRAWAAGSHLRKAGRA